MIARLRRTGLIATILALPGCVTEASTAARVHSQTEAAVVSHNREFLAQARARVQQFHAEQEPERLREAYQALENIILADERDPQARLALRADTLSAWLGLLRLLDDRLDPAFDPSDVPEHLVQPPPNADGVVYPPGADPKLIDDPEARARYEQAIAANRAKAEHYRLQIHFGRLDERLTPRVAEFIRGAYTASPADRRELTAAIDAQIVAPARRAALLRLASATTP